MVVLSCSSIFVEIGVDVVKTLLSTRALPGGPLTYRGEISPVAHLLKQPFIGTTY